MAIGVAGFGLGLYNAHQANKKPLRDRQHALLDKVRDTIVDIPARLDEQVVQRLDDGELVGPAPSWLTETRKAVEVLAPQLSDVNRTAALTSLAGELDLLRSGWSLASLDERTAESSRTNLDYVRRRNGDVSKAERDLDASRQRRSSSQNSFRTQAVRTKRLVNGQLRTINEIQRR